MRRRSFPMGLMCFQSARSPESPLALPSPGDTIILYGVGFGPVTPSIPAGQLVQQSNMLASSFQMLVGGVPATAAYAGLAPSFTGLYQFDITVPSVMAGTQPLTFTLGGNPGAQKLNIAVGN
jgi:uncharacterized protein (TIGR03437 family)